MNDAILSQQEYETTVWEALDYGHETGTIDGIATEHRLLRHDAALRARIGDLEATVAKLIDRVAQP